MSIVLEPPVTTEVETEGAPPGELSPLEILKRVERLLSDPKRWTTGHMATNMNGQAVGIWDKDAARFCLVGAAYRVFELPRDATMGVTRALRLLNVMPATFNDERGYDAVMRLLRETIAKHENG